MRRLVVAISIALAACVLSGCVVTLSSGTPPKDAKPGGGKSSEKAAAAACQATRMQVNAAYTSAMSADGHGAVGTSFESAVKAVGAKCPSGGSYSFDEKAGTTVCSVHGK